MDNFTSASTRNAQFHQRGVKCITNVESRIHKTKYSPWRRTAVKSYNLKIHYWLCTLRWESQSSLVVSTPREREREREIVVCACVRWTTHTHTYLHCASKAGSRSVNSLESKIFSPYGTRTVPFCVYSEHTASPVPRHHSEAYRGVEANILASGFRQKMEVNVHPSPTHSRITNQLLDI
jgi:hypothetical protein